MARPDIGKNEPRPFGDFIRWPMYVDTMRYVTVTEDMPDYDGIIRIYESSFPEHERIPLDMLIGDADTRFDAVYDDDGLVGLACVVVDGKLTFLFYLAVDRMYRSKGIGGRILEDICERYREPVILNIDHVDESYVDNNVRIKRRSFYLGHGFRDTGRILDDSQGAFNVLCKGVYNEDDYLEFLDGLDPGSCRIH